MRRLVFSLVAGLCLAAPVHAQAIDLNGEWRGRYVCSQGLTSLQVNIARLPDGRLAATFMFGPLPENPTVPKGAYAMSGVFDESTRRIKLDGVSWLKLPAGYVMVGLDGRVSLAGDRISGMVPGPGCTWFELRRMAPLIG